VDGQDGITLSERLANFVSALRYEDLPPQVVARAKSALLDTLGAGLAGCRTSEVARVIASVRDCGRGGTATIWGTDVRSGVTGAALINGTMAHSRELDDYGGCGHSGAVVVPAALAAGEHEAVSGRTLLTALVAGYDLAARVTEAAGGYRPHNARGWHSTGTCGSFGAAAAAAKCLGLDAAGTAAALGIAGSYTGGLWAFIVDGAMTKRLHPGKAAENGVFAAHLARHGFTGPAEILDAEWGASVRRSRSWTPPSSRTPAAPPFTPRSARCWTSSPGTGWSPIRSSGSLFARPPAPCGSWGSRTWPRPSTPR